jgi:WD40 repeat protein
MKQFSLPSTSLVKDYGEIHNICINSVKITPNSKFVLTIGDDKTLKVFSVLKMDLYKDFGRVHDDCISSLAISKFFYFSCKRFEREMGFYRVG